MQYFLQRVKQKDAMQKKARQEFEKGMKDVKRSKLQKYSSQKSLIDFISSTPKNTMDMASKFMSFSFASNNLNKRMSMMVSQPLQF